jgi:acyl-CoA thioesterase-1
MIFAVLCGLAGSVHADRPVDSASNAVAARSPETAPVLLVLGDSLSAGYGIALDQGWANLLQARIHAVGLPHQVVNASISGDTTAGGLARLPRLLDEYRPAVLVIELGANDGLRGFSPARIEAALAEMVGMARAAGSRVLLVGVRLPPNYGAAYSERFQRIFADVARGQGVALTAQLLDGVAEVPELMQADGLHPRASAQLRLLDNLWPDLLSLLQATAATPVE